MSMRLAALSVPVVLLTLQAAAGAESSAQAVPRPVPRPKLMVIGCESKISSKKWKDQRINFGVTNLIAETVADNGGFALVEEKPAIRDKLQTIRTVLWDKGERKVRKDLASLQADPPIYAIGRLVYFGAPRTEASFGGFAAVENKVIISVEVDLVLPDGETVTGAGRGEARKTATSALLTFREEGLFFEQTEVGTALKRAVTAGTTDVIREYKAYVREQSK